MSEPRVAIKSLLMNQYGYALATIRYEETGVTAIFTNGELVRGSIIIGSDGPRSQVRKEILGSEADVTPLEIVHSNVAITYGDAKKARFIRSAHPVFSFAVRPGLLSFLSSTSLWRSPIVHTESLTSSLQFKMFLIRKTPRIGGFRSSLAGWGNRMSR
jgi:2-polyprenyl-6-methoxyphenol hydroxylase-like FAD-dependent oxidoreductase